MEFVNQTYMFGCDKCEKVSHTLADFKPRHLHYGFYCDGEIYRQRYLVTGDPVLVHHDALS